MARVSDPDFQLLFKVVKVLAKQCDDVSKHMDKWERMMAPMRRELSALYHNQKHYINKKRPARWAERKSKRGGR